LLNENSGHANRQCLKTVIGIFLGVHQNQFLEFRRRDQTRQLGRAAKGYSLAFMPYAQCWI